MPAGTAGPAAGPIVIDQTIKVKVYLAGFAERAAEIAPSVVTRYTRSANGTDENGTEHGYPVVLDVPLDWSELPRGLFERLADHVNSTAQAKRVQGKLNFPQVVAMRDQKTRLDSFDELNGSEIKKESLASFLYNETPVSPQYAMEIFLLNLSYLDSRPGAPLHWLYEPTVNSDSGREVDWFRLEWDNAMNIPVAFPSEAGISGRRLFVDPSSYIWYLDWTNIWWQGGSGAAPYGVRYDDVPPSQRAPYLAGIINEYIDGLLTVLPRTPLHPKAEVATFILDDSQKYTADELKWTVTQPKVMDYLKRFTPYVPWTDSLVAAKVSSYPAFEKALRENTTVDPQTGYKRIDGSKVHQYIAAHKSEFITVKKDTISLITVCLYFENGAMFTQGNEFTGLGGGGVSSIYMNTSRLFYPGTQDRKMGISWVVVHETGHNLGYPHPSYRADLAGDVMGYYHDPETLSIFWEESYHKVRIKILAEQLNPRLQGVNDPRVDDLIQVFHADYRALRYVQAYYDLLAIRFLLDSKYVVYGDVVDELGGPLAGRDVTILNGRTGSKSLARTDPRGFYIVDAGAGAGGVQSGDAIHASVTDGAKTSFKDAPADATKGLRIDLKVWYSLPDAPGGLAASPSAKKVELRWTQAGGGGLPLKENVVYRGPTQAGMVRIASVAPATSYVDAGLADDTEYYYAISAVNELGEGPKSIAANARTPTAAPVPPTAPKDLKASAGDSWVSVSWSPPDDPGDSPVVSYIIHRRSAGGAFEVAGRPAMTTFNDSGLATGKYTYKVQAVNQKGRESANSSDAEAEVKSSIPPSGAPGAGMPPWLLPSLAALAIVLAALAAFAAVRRSRNRRREAPGEHAAPAGYAGDAFNSGRQY
jgi:hypothetical protein